MFLFCTACPAGHPGYPRARRVLGLHAASRSWCFHELAKAWAAFQFDTAAAIDEPSAAVRPYCAGLSVIRVEKLFAQLLKSACLGGM